MRRNARPAAIDLVGQDTRLQRQAPPHYECVNYQTGPFPCPEAFDPLRTSSVHRSTSERAVPEGTTHNPWKRAVWETDRLLDHLIGGRQQRFRDGEAEGLGGFEVDDQIELRGLLDG